MTPSPSLLAGAAFALAAGLSVAAAQSVTRELEERSVAAVADRLRADGLGWATVLGDGLQVVLEGEAPTEAARFEAISTASSVVDGARVIDNLRVAAAEELVPPDFALEILRNDAGVSLAGLVPTGADREEMAEAIASAAGGQTVTDLLQAADHPTPEGWEPALAFALEAVGRLPRSRISVAVGRVSIEALADSPEEQRRLEADLARLAPEGVRLALAVSAPRPVIAPFTVRVTLEDGLLAFDACSADTEEARDAILSAAASAGLRGQVDCRLGLGSPSPDWGAAVARGLAALGELGGGTLAFADADVALVAKAGTDGGLFDRVAAELDGTLPPVFALEATNPVPAAAEAPQGPPEFVATLSEEGDVRLQGRVEDERMAGLARAFAQARFGAADVTLATRAGAQGLPDGWSMRVLAGIEALSRLHEGSVTVTPDAIGVQGRTGRKAARDEIAARAIETLGAGAPLEIRVAYDEALDPLAALPSPEECLAKIASVTEAAKITFDPGSATISSEGEPVIEAIAGILRSCPDLRLRIGGYTDSQGREESNLRLSQRRAEAVLAALRAERVPVAGFEAQGFGEASPIASNDTESGREANRRIEFTLIGPDPQAASAGDPHDQVADPRADVTVSTGGAEAGDEQASAGTGEQSEGRGEAASPLEKPDAPPIRPRSVEIRGQEVASRAAESEAGAGEAEEDPVSPSEALEEIAVAPAAAPRRPVGPPPSASGRATEEPAAAAAATPGIGPALAPGVASAPAASQEEAPAD